MGHYRLLLFSQPFSGFYYNEKRLSCQERFSGFHKFIWCHTYIFPALSNKILSIISFALFTERYPSSIFLSEHYTVKNGMQEGSHNFPLLSTYHIPSRFYQSGTSRSTDALHVLMRCRIRLEAMSDPDIDSDIRLLWKKIIHPWKATMQ